MPNSPVSRIIDGVDKKIAAKPSLKNAQTYKSFQGLLEELWLAQSTGSLALELDIIEKLQSAANKVR